MNKPTVLRNSAEKSIVLGIALKIYYEQGDWVSNAEFLDKLDVEYDAIHKPREARSGGQAIAKFKPVLYYSLLDSKREGGDNYYRINEDGKKFYEAFAAGDEDSMVAILFKSIATGSFGFNNRAVPNSDSPIEPPKVCLLASLLLDGISRYEYAYALEQLSLGERTFEEILVKIKLARSIGERLEMSDYAKNNYADDKGILLLVQSGLLYDENGLRKIPSKYATRYRQILESLSIINANYQAGLAVSAGTDSEDEHDESIQEEFKYFLEHCVKVSTGYTMLSEATANSYFTGINGLTKYIQKIDSTISSAFEITNPVKAKTILVDGVLNDQEFLNYDSDKGNNRYKNSLFQYVCFLEARDYFFNRANLNKSKNMFSFFFDERVATDYRRYVNAFMTKPFVLLAGISGTGKSQIVRKFAQATDDIDKFENESDRWNIHKPENFELIQVKPNWHNSLDVVGYKSNINGAHYEFTPFVEFVAKAWMNPKTPFFLCLDEMNLAPVEQYFAEYLSAIESRSFDKKTKQYETDPIIKPFNEFGETMSKQMIDHLLGNKVCEQKTELEKRFREKGLTLPQNLIVMGTVNMDETTCSFSRKVLDRAMSIEMNEVDFKNCITPSPTDNPPVMVEDNFQLISRPIKSITVIDGNENVVFNRTLLSTQEAESVVAYLNDINLLLEGTPFKLGYRACNEALLYVRASKESSHGEDFMGHALDEFTTMKILSRIEGEDSKLSIEEGDGRIEGLGLSKADVTDSRYNEINLLSCLKAIIKKHVKTDGTSIRKIDEMNAILHRDHFVSYWG